MQDHRFKGRAMGNESPTRLKSLLQQRVWLSYSTFCLEYDRIAKAIDPKLVGSYPSRAQFHRWITGTVKNLPHAHHRAVLESMFPDWTIEQLFQRCDEESPIQPTIIPGPLHKREMPGFLGLVDASLNSPDRPAPLWGAPDVPSMSATSAVRTLPSPISSYSVDGLDGLASKLGRRLIELSRRMRLTDAESRQIANLAGHVVELELNLSIDIDRDGKAEVLYQHDILNLNSVPLNRMPREVWFKHTHQLIGIVPTQHNERRIVIQRIHDAGSLAKFAFKISPPLQPGERTVVRYLCTGGLFTDELYWRQMMPRYTRHYTFTLHHKGIGRLSDCAAIIEQPEGDETYLTEGLLWDYDRDDVTVTLTADYLRPGQVVELRWER
jgi:hypothetical protein